MAADIGDHLVTCQAGCYGSTAGDSPARRRLRTSIRPEEKWPVACLQSSPLPLPETRRADAERNVLRIQEAAIRLWAEEPNAGVADVAAAAGVGRATLYRHFPTRESLLEAIRTQGLTDGEAAVEALPPRRGLADRGAVPPAGRMARAGRPLPRRRRQPLPAGQPRRPASARRPRARRSGADPARAGGGRVLAGRAGRWGASAVGALLVAMIRGVGEGRIPREDAHPLLIRSRRSALL